MSSVQSATSCAPLPLTTTTTTTVQYLSSVCTAAAVLYLQGGGCGPYEQAQGLGHQRRGRGQGHEEQIPPRLRRLLRHPVHDAAVNDGTDDLERKQRVAVINIIIS